MSIGATDNLIKMIAVGFETFKVPMIKRRRDRSQKSSTEVGRSRLSIKVSLTQQKKSKRDVHNKTYGLGVPSGRRKHDV